MKATHGEMEDKIKGITDERDKLTRDMQNALEKHKDEVSTLS